jgi:hypothetical protein
MRFVTFLSLMAAAFVLAGPACAQPKAAKLEKLRPVGGFDWTGWASQGGVLVSGPDCVAAGPQRIDCFARGQDGQLRRRWWDGATWQAWSSAPGVANEAFYHSRPECVSWGEGHVDCFVRRHGDGVMFRRTWDGTYLHSWENLGGALSSDPECVSKAPARIDCFARGQDGALWQTSFDGNVWGAWISRGGQIADQSKPACAFRAANKIDCVVVWASDRKLRHFALDAPGNGWTVVSGSRIALPSSENIDASPKCYGAPDEERIDCFAPFQSASSGYRSLGRFSYDGAWSISDLSSDFGRAAMGSGQDIAHYDFDCVVRAGARFDCMELAVWRQLTGAPGGGARSVRFRHYAYGLAGAAPAWRDVALSSPAQAANVTFLKCLSVDGERMDCFTGGNWLGNATLSQASYTYQEKITFRPMNPVR